MRRFLLFNLLLFLLISCQDDEKVVYILFANSEGISTQSDVMLNGVSVGKVLEVDLTEDTEVITTVELSKDVDFPKGSAFEIQSKDVFTKIIHVTLTDSSTMIENGDTIQGIIRIDPVDLLNGGDGSPKLLDEIKEMLKN